MYRTILSLVAFIYTEFLLAQARPELVIPSLDEFYVSRVAAVNASQKLLISIGSDLNAKVWNLSTKTFVKPLLFSEWFAPRDVAAHEATKRIVVLSRRQLAWVDPERLTVVHTQTMSAPYVQKEYEFEAMAFSPDGKILYVAGDNGKEFTLWSLPANGTTFTPLLSAPIEFYKSMSMYQEMFVSPDGSGILILFGKQKAYHVSTVSKKVSKVPFDQISALNWAGNGILAGIAPVGQGGNPELLMINAIGSQPALRLKVNFEVRGIEPLSKDTRLLIYGDEFFALFDAANNTISTLRSWPFKGVQCAKPLADGKTIALSGLRQGNPALLLYDLASGNTDELGFSILPISRLASSADKATIVTGRFLEAELKVFAFSNNGLMIRSLPKSPHFEKMSVASNGTRAVGLTLNNRVILLDALSNKIDSLPKEDQFDVRSQVLNSLDGRYSVALGFYAAKVVDHHKGTTYKIGATTYNLLDKKLTAHLNMKDGGISPDGKKLITSVWDNEKSVICWDIESGKELWKIKGFLLWNIQFSGDGKTLVATRGQGQKVDAIWLDVDKGQIIKTLRLPFPKENYDVHGVGKASISNDLKTIIFNDDINQISLYDLTSGNLIGRFKSQKSVYAFEMLPGTRYALISISELDKNNSYQQNFFIYDFEKSSVVARIYLSSFGNDWLVLSPAGYFDANPGAMRRLLFRKNNQMYPVETFAADFYRPGLLASLLQGFEPPPVNWDGVNEPPVVRIFPPVVQRNLVVDDDALIPTYEVNDRKVLIKVEGRAQQDKVSEIRLFHNGKRVGTGNRNLVIDDDEVLASEKTVEFEVELSDGANEFRAVAVSSKRLESVPASMRVVFNPQNQPSPDLAKPNLHIVVVGINEYKNPRYQLNYAVADARAIADQLSRQAGSLFRTINKREIINNQATRENILAALEEVKRQSRPEDVFVFYFAGHGVVDSDEQYFLIPVDITQLYGDNQLLKLKALSANILKNMAANIPARKQLFLLDACQSAGALRQASMRAAPEEKALAELARATGTHWLAASGSEQFAAEFDQLGHGVFTYALLQALNGEADNGDNKISVKELDLYLQLKVPELSAKYKGTSQYPASFSFGNDFPVGIVRAPGRTQ